MPNDRFDFLEIGSNEASDDLSAPVKPSHSAERSPAPNQRRAGPTSSTPGSYEPIPLAENQDGSPLSVFHEPPRQSSRKRESVTGYVDIKIAEVFGQRGGGAGQFNFPVGIAVDRQGILFVADVYNHRVQRITPDGGVSVIGARGSGQGKFLAPTCVAVDEECSFYIVEQGNNRVQKFGFDGVQKLIFGRVGSRPGEFRGPMGICISPMSREILVADTGNGRIQRFSPEGDFVGQLGAAGSIHPPLSNPQSVTCDRSGNIFVADTLANRVARYDPLGRFMGFFGGRLGTTISNLAPNLTMQEPHALACDPVGDLYIADGTTNPGRVIVINIQNGQVRAIIEKPGKNLSPLSRPGGIAFVRNYRTSYNDSAPLADLYVSDTMNHRILRFTCG